MSLHKIALVVDDDLGFVAMLCQTLTDAGVVAVPVTAPERAMRFLQELRLPRADLAIINFALPGAVDLIQALRAPNGTLKIIAIEDARATGVTPAAVEGVIQKPSGVEPPSEREWLQIVEKVLIAERRLGAR